MNIDIRRAAPGDKDVFIGFTVELSRFNRAKCGSECRYDDYENVAASIRSKAAETFQNRNEDMLILMAELEGRPVGYALDRIYEESPAADNGGGRMGLFDELFVDETARGNGIGQKLLDETVRWFREKGIKRIKIHAYSWNDNAKKLYERNGFREYAVSYEVFIA